MTSLPMNEPMTILNIITRVILAPNERLTLFDLRTQLFRINVELSTHYHEHTRKKFSSRDTFSKIFFSSSVTELQWPKWVLNSMGKQCHFDHWWPKKYPKKLFIKQIPKSKSKPNRNLAQTYFVWKQSWLQFLCF